ncbi:MAG: type II secretion system protein, partial [Burkholderiales bacterium]
VALTIVAITLGAGIKAAGALTSNTQRLGVMSSAQWCADNYLAGLQLAHLTPPIGASEFKCIQLEQSFLGKVTVRQSTQNRFYNVDATIVDESGQPILHLGTLLPRP